MRGIKFPLTSAVTSARVEKIVDSVKSFIQAQLDEIRENKLRFGLIVTCLVVVIILSVADFESGEEINLNATEKNVENLPKTENISVMPENVKEVIGANSDAVFIQNPFEIPAQIDEVEEPPKVEEKILIPPPVIEIPKLPEVKFVLKGVAGIGDDKTALVIKISESKSEPQFLKVGEKIGNKIIIEIADDFLTLEDGEKIFME